MRTAGIPSALSQATIRALARPRRPGGYPQSELDDKLSESFLEKLFRQWAADIDERTHRPLENLQLDLARTEIPHQRRDTERPERSKVDAGALWGDMIEMQ